MDISTLANEHRLDEAVLKSVLDDTARLLETARESVQPASKKALRRIAQPLEGAFDRLSDETVRERLAEALFQEPDLPDADGVARYTAWFEARDKVNCAIESARQLLVILRLGEAYRLPAGRPRYRAWTIAIGSLVDFWTDDLGRDVTISGHASDPRGVKPSDALHFVHQCMLLVGEEITEQACRTILKNLRDYKRTTTP